MEWLHHWAMKELLIYLYFCEDFDMVSSVAFLLLNWRVMGLMVLPDEELFVPGAL